MAAGRPLGPVRNLSYVIFVRRIIRL